MLDASTYYGSTIALLLILVLASWTDLQQHRIPNILSLGGILLGIALQTWVSGATGFVTGFTGAAVAIGIFLPFYLLKGMGAGDVKLMGAVGAFLGPHNALLATGLSLAAGGLLGIIILTLRGGLKPLAVRYYATLKCFLLTGKLSHQPPETGEVAATKFPYAAAIGIGTLVALWWLKILQDMIGFFLLMIR
jgi:prepilin peptidase CpaA